MPEYEGEGTITGEQSPVKIEESPNMKVHGEPPPGSPMPGAENPDSDTVNNEINPNTE
ncbi:MAG TPA: hypothetical protein VD968_02765 [Pyrinomonadaceae bacterium]|nr:hypothetical protein [Pyrinomonadaceae bacterium]